MLEYISKTGSLSEPTARYFFYQLLKSISKKSKNEKIHKEIKPESIILDSQFNLKLAYKTLADHKECGYKIKDASSYKAPEVLAGLEYKPKQVDIFSAAVFLFMMVTQRLPFVKADPEDVYFSFIVIKDFKGFWAYHTLSCPEIMDLSKDFKDLFNKMVVVNGNDRLKIKKIKNHPWFKKNVPTHQEIFEIFSYRKLVLDGELQSDEIPSESGGSKPSAPQISDREDTSGETKEITDPDSIKNMPKKYTPYYNCKDGDLLMKQVITFAKQNKYSNKICDEYLRVIFQIKKDEVLTIIQVNVLRIPKHQKRCIECICVEGDENTFADAFESLDLHVFKNRTAFETV